MNKFKEDIYATIKLKGMAHGLVEDVSKSEKLYAFIEYLEAFCKKAHSKSVAVSVDSIDSAISFAVHCTGFSARIKDTEHALFRRMLNVCERIEISLVNGIPLIVFVVPGIWL